MTKFQLDVDYDYDFDLVGISSHARDYRLCWALNQKLGLQLAKKKEDLDNKPKKQSEFSIHSLYEYYHEEDHVEYQLLENRSGNSLIIPEYKQADYLLLLRNNHAVNTEQMIASIREIELVLTAYRIDVPTLKSKENLIF
ncbi:MAG: IPExxxVDY family protein [Bacteroidota bacterium]